MNLARFCKAMPKVELHVHVEGSIQPETLLKLAEKNSISLPATDVQGIRDWYAFRDFPHFIEVYVAVSKCIKTAHDLEFVIREFVDGQCEQNIIHTEATFSASTIERVVGIPWEQQEQALLKGIRYGEERGVSVGFVLDIVRGDTLEGAMKVAEWATQSEAVVALGLAGDERRGTKIYTPCFELAHSRNVPLVPHAGETMGAESIWETIEACQPLRIGHGVHCVEDAKLVALLRDRGTPLEVCPSSNVALGVYKSLDDHPLPQMLDEGLWVTINSDDPPMFGTTLGDEFLKCAQAFELNEDILWSLSLNAANAAILPKDRKRALIERMRTQFSKLAETSSP
jgi:aminodeoxyfutalosine deaminase